MPDIPQYIAYALGYGVFALVAFLIAFVLSKIFKRKWPYIVALVLVIIFYVLVFTGNPYVN